MKDTGNFICMVGLQLLMLGCGGGVTLALNGHPVHVLAPLLPSPSQRHRQDSLSDQLSQVHSRILQVLREGEMSIMLL